MNTQAQAQSLLNLSKAQLEDLIKKWLKETFITGVSSTNEIKLFSDFINYEKSQENLNFENLNQNEVQLFEQIEEKFENVFVKTVLKHVYSDKFEELAEVLDHSIITEPSYKFNVLNEALNSIALTSFSQEKQMENILSTTISTIKCLSKN